MKIWGQDFNPRVRKVQVAARYAGLDLTITEIDESKRKEYLKRNPTGIVPTLETLEGPLYESNAILRYIARSSKGAKLFGNSAFEEGLVNQWLDWCLTELEPAALAFSGAYLGFVPYIEEIHNKATSDLKKSLSVLDGHLKDKKHVVGNSLSIADISIASALAIVFQWVFDEKYRKSIPNVTKWFESVTSEENWKKTYGRQVLCKVPLQVFKGALDEAAQEAPVQAEAKKDAKKK